MLKAYCHDQQKKWEIYFALVQAILNDTFSSSIGRTPYEAAFGKRFAFIWTRSVSPSLEANRVMECYAKIQETVKERIAKAQEAYKRQANIFVVRWITKQTIGSIFASSKWASDAQSSLFVSLDLASS